MTELKEAQQAAATATQPGAVSLAAALTYMSKQASQMALGREIPTLPKCMVKKMLAWEYIDLANLHLAQANMTKKALELIPNVLAWIVHDTNYCQHMAEIGSKNWSKVDASIYSRCLTGWAHLTARRGAHNRTLQRSTNHCYISGLQCSLAELSTTRMGAIATLKRRVRTMLHL